MTSISKEQCIELAAKGLLDLDDWIKITGIGPDHYPKPPEDYKICSEGIFPIGFEYDREADNKDEAKYKAMIDAHRQLAKSEGRFGVGEIELTQKLREIHKSLEQTPYINGGLAFADSLLNQTGKASIAAPKLSAELHENLSNEEFKLLADVLENSSTDESFQELCKFENSPPLNFPCTPWRLIDFVDSDIWGIFDVPDFFREAVASQNLVDWYNNPKSLSASMWFGLQSAAPREAAMLLCQFNPQDDRLDPLEISNPETGPADYKRLLRVFEDESLPRTLRQWIAIARNKGLKYHSWIDEYVNVAMPAQIDGEQNTSSGTPESEALTKYRPRIGWQVALYDAWPAMRKLHGRDPSATEAVRYLKKHDESGCILTKGGDRELWWQPIRGKAKEVQFGTIESCISEWRTSGRLPA